MSFITKRWYGDSITIKSDEFPERAIVFEKSYPILKGDDINVVSNDPCKMVWSSVDINESGDSEKHYHPYGLVYGIGDSLASNLLSHGKSGDSYTIYEKKESVLALSYKNQAVFDTPDLFTFVKELYSDVSNGTILRIKSREQAAAFNAFYNKKVIVDSQCSKSRDFLGSIIPDPDTTINPVNLNNRFYFDGVEAALLKNNPDLKQKLLHDKHPEIDIKYDISLDRTPENMARLLINSIGINIDVPVIEIEPTGLLVDFTNFNHNERKYYYDKFKNYSTDGGYSTYGIYFYLHKWLARTNFTLSSFLLDFAMVEYAFFTYQDKFESIFPYLMSHYQYEDSYNLFLICLKIHFEFFDAITKNINKQYEKVFYVTYMYNFLSGKLNTVPLSSINTKTAALQLINDILRSYNTITNLYSEQILNLDPSSFLKTNYEVGKEQELNNVVSSIPVKVSNQKSSDVVNYHDDSYNIIWSEVIRDYDGIELLVDDTKIDKLFRYTKWMSGVGTWFGIVWNMRSINSITDITKLKGNYQKVGKLDIPRKAMLKPGFFSSLGSGRVGTFLSDHQYKILAGGTITGAAAYALKKFLRPVPVEGGGVELLPNANVDIGDYYENQSLLSEAIQNIASSEDVSGPSTAEKLSALFKGVYGYGINPLLTAGKFAAKQTAKLVFNKPVLYGGIGAGSLLGYQKRDELGDLSTRILERSRNTFNGTSNEEAKLKKAQENVK